MAEQPLALMVTAEGALVTATAEAREQRRERSTARVERSTDGRGIVSSVLGREGGGGGERTWRVARRRTTTRRVKNFGENEVFFSVFFIFLSHTTATGNLQHLFSFSLNQQYRRKQARDLQKTKCALTSFVFVVFFQIRLLLFFLSLSVDQNWGSFVCFRFFSAAALFSFYLSSRLPRLRKGRSPKGNTPRKAKAAAVVSLGASLLLLLASSSPSSSAPPSSRLLLCRLCSSLAEENLTMDEVEEDEDEAAASIPCPNAASAAAAAQRSCALVDRGAGGEDVDGREESREEEAENGTTFLFAAAAFGAGSIRGALSVAAKPASSPSFTQPQPEATLPNSTAEHSTPA